MILGNLGSELDTVLLLDEDFPVRSDSVADFFDFVTLFLPLTMFVYSHCRSTVLSGNEEL